MAIIWQGFSSNGHEKADYSKGVLERFTRHNPKNPAAVAEDIKVCVKTIANPRRVNFSSNAHFPFYFEGIYSLNESGKIIRGQDTHFVISNKIVVNHYHTKSYEEYIKKVSRGPADGNVTLYERYAKAAKFEPNGYDGSFDDGILRYRAERAKTFRPPDIAHADERLFAALASNLSPTLIPTTPPQFYAGKMETFLTCRAVAAYLKTRLTDDAPTKFFEEAALKAIMRTLANGGMSLADVRLLLAELPNLLPLPYPVVNDLRGACLNIIPQMMNIMRLNILWKDYVELDYLQRLLQTWK